MSTSLKPLPKVTGVSNLTTLNSMWKERAERPCGSESPGAEMDGCDPTVLRAASPPP